MKIEGKHNELCCGMSDFIS